MPAPARRVSVLFPPGKSPQASQGTQEALARHLVGRRLDRGQRVPLPGWPPIVVEAVDPIGGQVRPDTEVEVTLPEARPAGPANLAILVDASLTMGEGPEPTSYDRAARLVDGFLMNGRAFLGRAGIVVQGGETRHAEELSAPEDLTGALIHQVDPRGTFALTRGLDRAVELLDAAETGPRAILLVTDGDVGVSDPLEAALPLIRAGVSLFAVAEDLDEGMAKLCTYTGGRAGEEPEPVFEALAQAAGARGDWHSPSGPDPTADPEFEAVIETMEESR